MAQKIIITIEDDTPPARAIECVAMVMNEGKVSQAKHGAHYCWMTRFSYDNTVVTTRTKRHENAPDSFVVRKGW